jgi:hypothetical protein
VGQALSPVLFLVAHALATGTWLRRGAPRRFKIDSRSEDEVQTVTESSDAPRSYRAEVMERLFMDLQVEQFNQLYYRTRAHTTRRVITTMNVIAALTASAAFTGLLKNSTGGWLIVFQALIAVAAISAAVGPVLGLESKFSTLEQAALGHGIARDRLWSLLRDLKLSEIDESHEAREREICAFRDALSALDEQPHDSVKRSCWEVVERELPAEKSWTIV